MPRARRSEAGRQTIITTETAGVEKSLPGGITVHVYDGFGHLTAEYNDTITPAAPCRTCYLSWDHLGSVRLMTDQNGTLVAWHDYLPFGEELPANTAGHNGSWGTSGDNVNQKFTGEMHDQETGMDYFIARYYGAALGRFTSPDPGNAAQLERRSACLNSL